MESFVYKGNTFVMSDKPLSDEMPYRVKPGRFYYVQSGEDKYSSYLFVTYVKTTQGYQEIWGIYDKDVSCLITRVSLDKDIQDGVFSKAGVRGDGDYRYLTLTSKKDYTFTEIYEVNEVPKYVGKLLQINPPY